MAQTSIKKHTLNLREGDWDYLESIARGKCIPTSLVIRTLVSNKVDELRARENSTVPELDESL
jgi:hypothetical protein